MILRSLAELLEEMERDLARIDWQDVAIFCITAALVFGFAAGLVAERW